MPVSATKTPAEPARDVTLATGKITSKGQITIPVEIRRKMGVDTGDELIFETDSNGDTRVRKADRYPFEKFLGIGVDLPEEYQNREGIVRYMREMRGWDEIDEKIFGPVQPDTKQ